MSEKHSVNWKKQLTERILYPFLGAVAITLAHDLSDLLKGDLAGFIEGVTISFVFWATLANGNGLIGDLLDKKWTWLNAPTKRVVFGVLFMFVFSLIDSLIIIYLYVQFYLGYSFFEVAGSNGFYNFLIIPLIITTIIALWAHGRGFLISWRQAAIDVEKLKNENLKSRFESLRNQVNPHFLFNSLNTLSSLVHEDQEKATRFIQKLSEVYRYVLDHQSDEVVELDEEMSFLKSFVHLNEIRFGDKFTVQYEGIKGDYNGNCIPPVTLQMLLENVIKHNEISSERPLKVKVSLNQKTIMVENNINPLLTPKHGNRVGLNNITSRYQMLTDREVLIEKTKEYFRVTLPQLKLES